MESRDILRGDSRGVWKYQITQFVVIPLSGIRRRKLRHRESRTIRSVKRALFTAHFNTEIRKRAQFIGRTLRNSGRGAHLSQHLLRPCPRALQPRVLCIRKNSVRWRESSRWE